MKSSPLFLTIHWGFPKIIAFFIYDYKVHNQKQERWQQAID